MEREQRWYWPDTLTLCFLLPPGGTATVVVEITGAKHSTEQSRAQSIESTARVEEERLQGIVELRQSKKKIQLSSSRSRDAVLY